MTCREATVPTHMACWCVEHGREIKECVWEDRERLRAAVKGKKMAEKKKRYLLDEVRDGRYVRCWKEGRGRGEYVVQIWNKTTPEGEPDGDWGMPGEIGFSASVDQALLQTPVKS